MNTDIKNSCSDEGAPRACKRKGGPVKKGGKHAWRSGPQPGEGGRPPIYTEAMHAVTIIIPAGKRKAVYEAAAAMRKPFLRPGTKAKRTKNKFPLLAGAAAEAFVHVTVEVPVAKRQEMNDYASVLRDAVRARRTKKKVAKPAPTSAVKARKPIS